MNELDDNTFWINEKKTEIKKDRRKREGKRTDKLEEKRQKERKGEGNKDRLKEVKNEGRRENPDERQSTDIKQWVGLVDIQRLYRMDKNVHLHFSSKTTEIY